MFIIHSAQVAQLALNAGIVVAVLLAQLGGVVAPDVADVFEEEHDEDVVFVLGGVNGTAEGVTRFPEDAVDFVLVDGYGRVVHAGWFLIVWRKMLSIKKAAQMVTEGESGNGPTCTLPHATIRQNISLCPLAVSPYFLRKSEPFNEILLELWRG
jgi:hypothetical protein